jgi:hypothetical protein
MSALTEAEKRSPRGETYDEARLRAIRKTVREILAEPEFAARLEAIRKAEAAV